MITVIDICIIGSILAAAVGLMLTIFCDENIGVFVIVLGMFGVVLFATVGMTMHTNSVDITYTAANEVMINTNVMDTSKVVRLDVVEYLEGWDERTTIKTIDYPKRDMNYPVFIRPGSDIEVYATYLTGEYKLVATTSTSIDTFITGNPVSSPKGNIVDVQECNKNRRPFVVDISLDGVMHYA